MNFNKNLKCILSVFIMIEYAVFTPLIFAEKINFSADIMNGNAGKNSEYTLLNGNARVDTNQMEIQANVIEMSGQDFRYITATGKVSGKHKEGGFDFNCEKITYDRQTKIALLEGGVNMDDQKNAVTASAQFIEYNEVNDVAIMQIDIKLINKNSTCTAAFAIYRKKSKMLEMSGNPQIAREDDTFRAQEIIFNIDTEEIIMDGKVKGKVTDKKAETKATPAATEKAPAQPTTTTTTPATTENPAPAAEPVTQPPITEKEPATPLSDGVTPKQTENVLKEN